MKILVTGTAGFIGFHLAEALVARGDEVVGIDNICDYYDVGLKYARLAASGVKKESVRRHEEARSSLHPGYRFVLMDLLDRDALSGLIEREKFDAVCHLAAQAGVRYSLENPYAYIDSNITGFVNILEACRRHGTKHLVFASSSSVYGLNEKMPFSTSDNVGPPREPLRRHQEKQRADGPHLQLPLRHAVNRPPVFHRVRPLGQARHGAVPVSRRPSSKGRTIDVFNNGDMERDFTYVDDIVEGVVRVIDRPPKADPGWSGAAPDPARSKAAYRIYNIGNRAPVRLLDFIGLLEKKIGKQAVKNFLPMQPGDLCRDLRGRGRSRARHRVRAVDAL